MNTLTRTSGAIAAVLAASLAFPALASGEPGATAATIPAPRAGDMTVAHLVVQAKPKPKPKPKKKRGAGKAAAAKAPAPPRVTARTRPAGLLGATSWKRDAKRKDRFHVTIALTNPKPGPLSLLGADADAGAVDLDVVAAGFTIIVVDVLEEAEQENAEPAWAGNCAGFGDRFFLGADTSAAGMLDLACLLVGDDNPDDITPFLETAGAVGVNVMLVRVTAFPGRNDELVLQIGTTIVLNALVINLGGPTIVAYLPPQGALCGVMESLFGCLWDRGEMPRGMPFTANVRLSAAPSVIDGDIRGSADRGQTFTGLFPVTGANY